METADSCDTDDDDEGARGGRVLPEQPKRLMGGSFPVLFVAAAIFVTRARGGGAIALVRRLGVRGVCDGDVRCIIHELSDAPSSPQQKNPKVRLPTRLVSRGPPH